MKYVCTRKAFINIGGGKARLFKPGEVYNFDSKVKVPKDFFRVIAGQKAELTDDLEKVSLDELKEGDYKIADLRAYAEEHYGVKLKGTSKADVAESFVDARFRHLEDHETEGIL